MKTETIKYLIIVLLITILINPISLYVVLDKIWLPFALYVAVLVLGIYLFSKRKAANLYVYFLSFVTVVSILVHAELVFVARFKDYRIESLYQIHSNYYFNRPHLKEKFLDKEFAVNYVTSEEGFRIGLEDDPETKLSQVDWMFLGDSYTQGAQVEFEELYTSHLNGRFPQRVIANCGISGWGVPDAYNYYKDAGYKLGAKKVFLQICNFNDFMNVNERKATYTDYIMEHSEFLRFVLYPFRYSNPAELPLGRWTEPFYPTLESNQDYNVFFKTKSERQITDLANFEDYILRLNDLVKQNGGELIVMQLPTKEQLYYRYFEEVVNNFSIDVAKLQMDYPDSLLSSICSSNKITHLNLFKHFSQLKSEVYFQYDEHLNAIGHAEFANAIEQFLVAMGEAKSATKLSKYNSEDRYPSFGGSNVVSYQSMRDSNLELFVSDSLLAAPKRLTFNNVDELHPWLDPRHDRIFFTEGDQSLGRTRVASMNMDGSQRKYLTGDNYFGAIPSVDREGKRVAYPQWTSDSQNRLTNPRIVIHELDGNTITPITTDDHESWRPVFSSDDRYVFCISKTDDEAFDIFQIDIATGVSTNLTNTTFDEWDLSLSPDGKSIVYAGKMDGNWDIFKLELATGIKTRVTSTIGDEWDTSFCSGGCHIYYAGVYGFSNGIYRIDNPN
jgi:Tol biopolymer transport system component